MPPLQGSRSGSRSVPTLLKWVSLIEMNAPNASDWVSFRQDLHRHPELGFAVERTAEKVAKALTEMGVEVHRGLGKTGVVGVLRRGNSDAAIALRADMDALPIDEIEARDHRSEYAGKMHACGHDGHTTMLLAAAEQLAACTEWEGTIVFVFQPAEEGIGRGNLDPDAADAPRCGGEAMVRDGLFERFPVRAVYALHNWPALPVGTVAVRVGAMMAATDEIEILFEGRGGHAAMPDEACDPVIAMAHFVVAAQTLISREVAPAEAAGVRLTQIETRGTRASNVIPGSVLLRGTVRSLSLATRALLHRRLREQAAGVAATFGCKVHVMIDEGYPPTINAPRPAGIAERAARRLPDVQVRTDLPPSMGAEDFAFLAQAVAGAYLWLGQADDDHTAKLHSPAYDFHDGVLSTGIALFCAIVREELGTER